MPWSRIWESVARRISHCSSLVRVAGDSRAIIRSVPWHWSGRGGAKFGFPSEILVQYMMDNTFKCLKRW